MDWWTRLKIMSLGLSSFSASGMAVTAFLLSFFEYSASAAILAFICGVLLTIASGLCLYAIHLYLELFNDHSS